jgi:hypothetical protein
MERTLVERAGDLELWARDGALDVVRGGQTVLASDQRHAEVAFAELTCAPWVGRDDITVLVDGLGFGGTLRAVLDRPGVVRVDVVEPAAALIAWQPHFAALSGDAVHDPRVQVHQADFPSMLVRPRVPDLPPDGWFVVLTGDPALQDDDGLRRVEGALRGGGVIGTFTAAKDDPLLKRMAARFQSVTRVGVAGDLGLEYVYRGRRTPKRAS